MKIIENTHAKEPTQNELVLGLKVNHMYNRKLEDINLQPVMGDYFITSIYNPFTNKKSDLFCLNNEYTAHFGIKSPQWSFFMLGHGIINSLIVGRPLLVFRIFLDIIAFKITTDLLIYQSCYATGYNTVAVYKDFQSSMQKTYPYAILVGAVNDSVSFGSFNGDFIGNVFYLNPKTTVQYKEFFTQIIHGDTIDYYTVAENFFRDLELPEVLPNLPQIKLPGLEWFSVLDAKKFVYISNNMARSRTEPLKIQLRNKAQMLLVYPPYIPFEIIINTPELHAVISMLPGSVTHFIKKIKSNISLDYILKIFTQSKPGFKKNFLIEDVEINSASKSEKIKIQNLFIDYDPLQKKWNIIYVKNESLYTYHKDMHIALAQTPSGLDLNAFKQYFKNAQSIMEKFLFQSPLVGFNFIEALKKYKERQTAFDELVDVQTQFMLLQSLQ